MSPMQRTKKYLKDRDIWHGIVERWIPMARLRVDLFGIIDLIALEHGIVGIQVCGSDYQSHISKIRGEKKENTIKWLSNGGRLEVWSWRKYLKKRGGKAKFWKPCIADITVRCGEIYIEELWK